MKTFDSIKALFVLTLLAISLSAEAQLDGSTFGNSDDLFNVNSNSSEKDASIRLLTRNGSSSYRDWLIWNDHDNAKLNFSYWSSSSHSSSKKKEQGTTRMVITSGGNVGIGTTNPNSSYKLHVAGDVYANGGWVRVSDNRGIHFQTHGGSLYMQDANWIRANKGILTGGTLRADGNLQVGFEGANFHVDSNGDVGIGKKSPAAKLDVNGAALFAGNISFGASSGRGIRFWNNDNYAINMGNSSEFQYGDVTDYSIKLNMSDHANRGWTWGVDGETPIAALNTEGNMKISGKLEATTVKVTVGSFPDYVFADDYKLLSIEEVNQFIQTNKHLPNIPAASEILEKGMDIGQINVLLTEKVEELTLYTIQQQNALKSLESENTTLKTQVEELKKLLNTHSELLQKISAELK